MSKYVYENAILTQVWDDTARTYTEFDPEGQPINDTPRPYTAEENAQADARVEVNTLIDNEQLLLSRAKAAVTANNSFLADTNVQAYLDAASPPTAAQTFAMVKIVIRQVRVLTKISTALIKLVARDFLSTAGTE